MFPDSEFYLVDSIGKKIRVVNEVRDALGLKNVTAVQQRAEDVQKKFDFVVSRAVTQLPKFIPWVQNKFRKEQRNAYPNGIFYLKGGDLTEELQGLKRYHEVHDLSDYFDSEFFETKKVLYVGMTS